VTLFAAKLTTVGGLRSAELSCVLNAYDRERPRVVKLIVRKELTGIERLPFAYQFLEEAPPERREPMLVIMAAPGVSVVLEGFPDTYAVGPGYPLVEVYRIQDPELLPPLGADLTSLNFIGSFETGDGSRLLAGASGLGGASGSLFIVPDNLFKIDRLPDALLIKHIATEQEWIIEVPQISSPKQPFKDAQARIAYEVDLEGKPGSIDKPLLKIVKTPGVSITMADKFLEPRWTGFPRRDSRLAVQAVYEVDDINDVPPQGAPIIPKPHWREVRSFKRVKSISETLIQAGFDVSLSAIPIVGDASDIAEFVYGIASGKDKWGNELTAVDLTIMGIAAVLPFVGTGLIKSGKALVRAFGTRAETARTVLEAVNSAKLNSREADLVRVMQKSIRAGKRPTDAMLQSYGEILRRIWGRPPILDDLINTGGSGFMHVDLQEAYQAYKKGKVKTDATMLSPREWALKQTTGTPRRILETLLGADYAKRTTGAIANWSVNLVAVPRPASLTYPALAKHLDELTKNPDKLLERLEKVLEAEKSSDEIVRFLFRKKVTAGHFKIMKGNVAEILSLDLQKQVLKEVAIKYPGAKLITGIRMRVMEGKKLSGLRLFTDNIIAVEKKGHLEVLAVFEVKAGYKGGQEATEQVFEWVERIIEDGSQVVLPRGATMLAADGSGTVLTREIAFTYKPGRRDLRSVTSLMSAERYVFTARNASHLGMDSAMRTAKGIVRKELEVTAEELDYLCAYLLERIESGKVAVR
jgi:hypothetical protein